MDENEPHLKIWPLYNRLPYMTGAIIGIIYAFCHELFWMQVLGLCLIVFSLELGRAKYIKERKRWYNN